MAVDPAQADTFRVLVAQNLEGVAVGTTVTLPVTTPARVDPANQRVRVECAMKRQRIGRNGTRLIVPGEKAHLSFPDTQLGLYLASRLLGVAYRSR
jgi:hypothetical protein